MSIECVYGYLVGPPSLAAKVFFSSTFWWASPLNMMSLLLRDSWTSSESSNTRNQNWVIPTAVNAQLRHIPIILKEIFRLWFVHFMRQIVNEELVAVRVSHNSSGFNPSGKEYLFVVQNFLIPLLWNLRFRLRFRARLWSWYLNNMRW